MEELLSLKWNNHRSTFLHILGVLRDKQLYTDATLACDGNFYSVHRLVLSTCSDYFSAMFDKTTNCKNPIIVLKDIKCADLEALLDYMYLGEVNVRQADLASLIKSAECLRVKGLAVPDDEPPKKPKENLKRSEGGGSPPSKRKRRDEGHDGREDIRPPRSRSKSPSRERKRPSTSEHEESKPLEPSRVPTEDSDNASCDIPLVKVEPEDNEGDVIVFPLSNEGYKEEPEGSGDPGGDMGDDMQEFLQSSNSDMGDNSYGTFPGTSSYSTGDLSGWQGDNSNLNFSSQLNYGSESSSQNAPGGATNIAPKEMHHRAAMMTTYPCQYCGKNFPVPSKRTRHERAHLGDKPHKCHVCGYRGGEKHHLEVHILKQHGPQYLVNKP